MCLRTKLETGPYRILDTDVSKFNQEAIYVVPDTNIFMHKYETIQDLLFRGNLVCNIKYIYEQCIHLPAF